MLALRAQFRLEGAKAALRGMQNPEWSGIRVVLNGQGKPCAFPTRDSFMQSIWS